jgi:hypothetical protein
MTELLGRFPGEPYIRVAERLGENVAALQLEWMHFGEATARGEVRRAAMDSLARDLNAYIPNGWRHGAKGDFDTARAFASWATRLEQYMPELKSKANAIWDTLEAIKPQAGWSPSGPDDDMIAQAFSIGWPEN